ncbi:MAG TPA: prepilin-type N-terminal cleavage/methylation domain-containing protein [Candidatus Pacearchaeota archaeon]|nr:prepilin-type N-terminal cleavage/methylation domain-containing protein [Candidatus Pacearchaeota archaeon]
MKIKSFTLIELMAVVTIIAILSGIVVYGINEWKDDANLKKTIAYSNEVKNKLGSSLLAEWKMEEKYPAYDSGRFGINGYAEGTSQMETNCPEGNGCIYSQGAEILFYQIPYNLRFKSICFWIKTGNASFVLMENYNDFKIDLINGLINFNVYSADGVFTSIPLTGKVVNDNAWHFVCGAIDNSSKFYGIIDGETKASTQVEVSSFGRKSFSGLCIGCEATTFSIDDLMIFEDSIF